MSKEPRCRCLELEERVLKVEEKYIELETELQKRNKEFESLELRFKELESEKLVVDEELRNLKESKKGSLIEQVMIKESTGLVDLCGSETEERSEKESADAKNTLEEGSISESYEDEDVNTSTPPSSRKRKRVIASDSENDDDDDDEDNIPISSILKNLKPQNQEMTDLVDTPTTEENRSGRLRTQRRVSSRLNKKRVSNEIFTSTERLVGIPTTDNAEDDETEEEELESESESLDGFIVDDDSQETVSEKSDETGEEVSDEETGYADVMSRLRRDKKPEKRKWEYEADMLSDFVKDPELCMRAVCVLYRLETEKWRSSHFCNGRGFNKYDATRGTCIASFLTDGDPASDLKKSVEELKIFDSEAVAICEKFACRYSKQVFQVYNNREDPFFAAPPSP